jgi:hypothetical protein
VYTLVASPSFTFIHDSVKKGQDIHHGARVNGPSDSPESGPYRRLQMFAYTSITTDSLKIKMRFPGWKLMYRCSG